MIEADRVTHRAGAVNLVDDVSLTARGGEILAIVGPNGAGKSTLLRLLTGELLPSRGEIRMGGRPLDDWKIRERARVRAMLPQNSDLSLAFSSYDVVLLGRSSHTEGRETLRDQSIARLALSATDALVYEDRLYPTLSGGERQRVHAARAMAQIWEGETFRVLLMDEPTANLDLSHQHVVLAEVRRMAESGCAVVCVLHDLNLAAQYADRVAVLDRGHLRALGTPVDVLSQELVCDVFDVDARVVPHPALGCPLVVPMGPGGRGAALRAAAGYGGVM